MPEIENQGLALALDLDGVLIWRPIPFQLSATIRRLRHGTAIFDPPQKLPEKTGFGIYHISPTPMERLSLLWHQPRFVYPGVAENMLNIKNVDIYGNTGRLGRSHWNRLTRAQLERAFIMGRFKDIFFRPEGISTKESKLLAVDFLLELGYARVRCIDDNPADLLPICKRFPSLVDGVLISDWSTKFLLRGVDLKEIPNFYVVRTFHEAVSDLL